MSKKIIVVGSGNAAMCAGIAALENGADVLILEKADDPRLNGPCCMNSDLTELPLSPSFHDTVS